ncbi:hypothetical protein LOCC1_G003105 [Lachnellula occidentalis]|uniref:DUF7702 domain-containing protein n=1 Tax=Lachnellula occidentalis TaxID=215460 RepID=A0A8H8SAD0_9HELO|nr:hypothetical protein LOCC1_G003105 [Lachnellula occidentalis]
MQRVSSFEGVTGSGKQDAGAVHFAVVSATIVKVGKVYLISINSIYIAPTPSINMGNKIREGIAIVDLVLYIPLLITVIFVLIRHGFQKQLGWIYLLIFTVVRSAGAVMELLYIHDPSNSTYLEWSMILASVGLSPLLLASLGLLKRVIDCTSTHVSSGEPNVIVSALSERLRIIKRLSGKATANSRRSRLIQLLQLPTTIALILCVVGGMDAVSSSSTPSEIKTGLKDTKWGMGIFIVIYILLCILTIVSTFEIRKTVSGERRVLLAVIIALPLIGSRLLWSVLCAFKGGKIFNIENGSAVVQIAMADVEEFIIVFLYVIAGLSVGKYDEREVSRQRAKENVYAPQQSDGRVDARDGAMAAWRTHLSRGLEMIRGTMGVREGTITGVMAHLGGTTITMAVMLEGTMGVMLSRLFSLSIVRVSFVWG